MSETSSQGHNLDTIIASAHDLASANGAAFLRPEHLLFTVLDDPDLDHLVRDVIDDVSELRRKLEDRIEAVTHYDRAAHADSIASLAYSREPTQETEEVIGRARVLAKKGRFPEPSGMHIFLAIAGSGTELATLLRQRGASTSRVSDYLAGVDVTAASLRSPIEEIAEELERTNASSPQFVETGERLTYQQKPPRKLVAQARQLVLEYLEELEQFCALKGNTHPQLTKQVLRYRPRLRSLGRTNGAVRLFIEGAAIERMAAASKGGEIDEAPPLDAQLLAAAEAFLIAHANLMSLFPDVAALVRELDVYVDNLAALDDLRRRLVAPMLGRLASSCEIFDPDTQLLNAEVARPLADPEISPSPASMALGLRWLRGALASMGRVMLAGLKHYGSEWPKLAARWTAENLTGLTAAIFDFLRVNTAQLLELAGHGHAFRWLRMLLELIGLGWK